MGNFAGVWGCEFILGPEVRGSLTIAQAGPEWHASICGFEASARLEGDTLRFGLPGSRGEFRGRVTSEGGRIVGHWVQPPGTANRNAYATPLEFVPQGSGTWRGEVVPLDDRLDMYLVVQQQPDGGLTAFLRDPGRNVGLRLPFVLAHFEGSTVSLVDRAGRELLGRYDEANGTLSVMLPFYPVTLDFTRRDPNAATGFYPRTPVAARYEYRQPLPHTDGWQTSSLADVGLEPGPIEALVEQILGTQTTSVTTPYIHSLSIARHGRLVLDEYFYGFHRERPHDMRSASKSLTAALVGVAIDRGAGFDLDTPIYSLFPEHAPLAHDGNRKRKVTVEHLLTMTSGFDCDDDDDSTPGNEDNMQDQQAQPDWYKYTLDLPMLREPGEQGVYCSAGINLLGGIVSNATATWLPDFFQEHFAGPLQFGRYYANLMPLGNMYGGGGAYIRPRDFMKLGQVYLSGGRWNGRQVISREWVARSLQPHSRLQGHDYGYGWHLGEYQVGGSTYRRAEAGGNGGQFAIIVPDLDLVVMFTAGNYGNFGTWSKFRDELVPQFIIPAVRS